MVTTTENTRNTMAKKEKAGRPEKGTKTTKANTATDKLIENNPQLKTALQQIEKQFGEGSIMALGSGASMCDRGDSDRQPVAGHRVGRAGDSAGADHRGVWSGIERQDDAWRCTWRPKRRSWVGSRRSSTPSTRSIPSWAKKLGVELETLLVSQPTSGEEAMQITEMLIKSNAVDVIIVDSVAALVPRQELEGEIGDSHVGLQARLMSQSMRKLTGAIAKSKTAVIFINQIREKIGVMFGSPETTPGGRALKFYSSCRIDVRRIGQLKDGEEVVGQRVRCKVVKNKVAPPFRVAEFDMMHTNGISYEGDVLDLAVAQKVVARSGSWFKYGDDTSGAGQRKGALVPDRESDGHGRDQAEGDGRRRLRH